MKNLIVNIIATVAFAGCVLPASPSYAQTDAAVTSTDLDSYSVMPDDVLSISVIGFTDLTVPQVVVLQDGTITLPLLNSVTVQGKTPTQIQAMLTKRWSKYVINPSVSVALLKKHEQDVSFSGYVLKPGPLPYRPDLHVCEALAEDGGALPTGDLSKVTITDSTGQKQTLDLSHPETKEGTDVDVLLNVDDVVYVPEKHSEFSVVGEIKEPGSFPFVENMTVLDALTQVGGVLPDADLNDATIMHAGQESPLDLDALMRHGDLTQNIKLSPGDRITVPEGDRLYVYGAVNKPGYYTYHPGDTVLDALNAVGGPQPSVNPATAPDLAKINLIATDKLKKTATVTTVDLAKYFRTGNPADNPSMRPGDVLYVPTKGHHASADELMSVLTGAGNGVYLLSHL